MVLDAPQHEDDGGDDGEDEGVGEVTVEGKLHHVSAQAQRARCLNQRRKDQPTDGAARGEVTISGYFERIDYFE